FIGIRVNRAKKSGMVNITSSVNSRERSGINTILHELNPLFTINVTMRDIKSKNVYSTQEMQQQDNHEYPFLYQRQTCHRVQPNQATYQKRQKCQPATY